MYKTIDEYRKTATNNVPLLLATLRYQDYQVECFADHYWKEGIIFTLTNHSTGESTDSHRVFPKVFSAPAMQHTMCIILKELVSTPLPLAMTPWYLSNIPDATDKLPIYLDDLYTYLVDATADTHTFQLNGYENPLENTISIFCYHEGEPEFVSILKEYCRNS